MAARASGLCLTGSARLACRVRPSSDIRLKVVGGIRKAVCRD
ncbi:hypothetical protein ACWA7J_04910 [Leptothrix sp. BB-4]